MVMTDPLHTFQVDQTILDRWKLIAEQFGDEGAGLRLQLAEIDAGENTYDTLMEAVEAARLVKKHTHGELQALAVSLAAEIENAASH